MTGDPMMHPDRTEPRGHCIGCGHPITGETCTECGGAVADGVLLKQASRNLGWIIALLAIAWGIDIAAFLAVNPFLPGMLSLGMISLLMFLSSILHAAGLILTAIVCLLLLTTRGWRPSDAWRIALWGLVVMLPLLSGTNLLIALAGLFTDRADLGLWVVLTPILEAIGLVVLVTAIGACSLRTPGGGDRWFLSRAWIALGAITALQITLGIVFRSIAMSNNPVPDLQLIQALSNLLGVVLIGSHLFKIVFLGFLIPWKRTLAGCAEGREPAGT